MRRNPNGERQYITHGLQIPLELLFYTYQATYQDQLNDVVVKSDLIKELRKVIPDVDWDWDKKLNEVGYVEDSKCKNNSNLKALSYIYTDDDCFWPLNQALVTGSSHLVKNYMNSLIYNLKKHGGYNLRY